MCKCNNGNNGGFYFNDLQNKLCDREVIFFVTSNGDIKYRQILEEDRTLLINDELSILKKYFPKEYRKKQLEKIKNILNK